MCYFFFFKQKTAYEMRISDWSSDVCSSDLPRRIERVEHPEQRIGLEARPALDPDRIADPAQEFDMRRAFEARAIADPQEMRRRVVPVAGQAVLPGQRLPVA